MKKAENIYFKLKEAYPDAKCELEYNTPFQLLISTLLSAQATDKSVNAVTKNITIGSQYANIQNNPKRLFFTKYPT